MELLVLGLLLGAGAAKRKQVTKALAKGYMTVAETSTHLREDMRAAIEEAQKEQDREPSTPEASGLDASEEMLALQEEADSGYPAMEAIEPAVKPAWMDQLAPPRDILKSVARRCLALSEMTRSATAHVREDLRDAVEEARYEREQAASRRAAASAPEETVVPGGRKTARSRGASAAEAGPPDTMQKATAPAAKPKARRARTPGVVSVDTPPPAPKARRTRAQKTTAAPATTRAAAQKTRPSEAAPQDAGAQPMAAETNLETIQ